MESKYKIKISLRPSYIPSGVTHPGLPDAVAVHHVLGAFPFLSAEFLPRPFSPSCSPTLFSASGLVTVDHSPAPPHAPHLSELGSGEGAFTKLAVAAGAAVVHVGSDRAEEEPFLW